MPMYLLLTIGSVPAGLLATLALLARQQRSRIGEPAGQSVTDELDNLEELQAHARAVAAAAEQAVAAADEAHHRAGHAVQVFDLAGWRYRQIRQQAQATEPLRLVERAALNAYRRGQLSAAELNRIWQHTQATAGSGTYRANGTPVQWDSRVHAARQRYEQAAIEVTDVHKKAQVTTIAARVLAEEAHVAQSHLTAAQHSTSTGLAALFLAE